jgi:hypothetical protein
LLFVITSFSKITYYKCSCCFKKYFFTASEYSETLELFSLTELNMGSIEQNSVLMHLNDFYEFVSIEPNSKKHRNIERIRSGSISQESSRVSLYKTCNSILRFKMNSFQNNKYIDLKRLHNSNSFRKHI